MSDALVIVLVAVMSLVLLDAAVLGGVVLARRVRHGSARRAGARPTAPVGTLLYAVPQRLDVASALGALSLLGYGAVTDPVDDRLLLIACPRGIQARDEVRSVLSREARRSTRTPGWSGPVRFADEV